MSFLRCYHFLAITIFSISLLFYSGCSDDSPNEPQSNRPVINAFTATPSVISAAGDTVTLSWKVTGATSLSISNGVGSVTPVDSGSIKKFVAVSTTFTLTATNAAGNVTADAAVNASQTTSINGYVKDFDGEPITGVTVMVKGKTPVTTNADGSFSITGVAVPYEIRVIHSTEKAAIIYQGLTRTDPTLLFLGSMTTSKDATISGYVPAAAGRTTRVFFVSGSKAWGTIANPVSGFYSISAIWKGQATHHDGKLYVLRYTVNTSNLPAEYDAYGSKDLTISNGSISSGNNFAATDFTDPAETNITGAIGCPTTSYKVIEKFLYLNFSSASIYLAGEISGAGLSEDFSYKVPSLPGTSFEVTARAEASAMPNPRQTMFRKKGITAGATGVQISLCSAPQLNLPAHNGTGIDTTTQFLWTQGSGTGVNLIYLNPAGAGPVLYIFTSADNTFIPNLNPQGMGLPAGSFYNWSVTKYMPLLSIDEAASGSFIPLISGSGGDNGMGASETFSFTTAP